jgi:RNA polymerase sigma-70 factor (ECF subfamily)
MRYSLPVRIRISSSITREVRRRATSALRHFEELSNGEAAEVLGLSETAASNRYIRAPGRLRDHLERVPRFFDEG